MKEKIEIKLTNMENSDFTGWSDEAINGYLTAVKTLQEFLNAEVCQPKLT